MGRQEEVSCQSEVRRWNACAHDQERNVGGGEEKREREEKGRDRSGTEAMLPPILNIPIVRQHLPKYQYQSQKVRELTFVPVSSECVFVL